MGGLTVLALHLGLTVENETTQERNEIMGVLKDNSLVHLTQSSTGLLRLILLRALLLGNSSYQ